MTNFPFLSILTLLPLVGAIVVGVLPRRQAKLAKTIALGWSVVVFALSVVMWFTFKANGAQFQFRESYKWIPQWDVRFTFATDGIALVMLMLIAILFPIAILASWREIDEKERSVPIYFALLLLFECTMIGVFAAADVFLFYVFFEVMLIPMYFIIGSFGGPRRQYAAVKFFIYSLVGGLFMLAAVIGLWAVGGHTFDFVSLVKAADGIDTNTARWLFLGFFVAFAIKAPFFPFHTWLPDAGGAAPVGAAALLVGVMDKVGTFGILRYCLPLFPEASRWFAPAALVLGVIGIIYAALLAVGQNDLKRLVSYTSIAHFGFIGIGIFAFTTQGGTGAVLYMVNHGLATGLLFTVVGMYIARRGSNLVSDFGGAGKLTPVLAGVLFFAGLASLALPGTAPFVSEFLVLIGTFTVHKVYAVIATAGIILAAAYVLWMVQRTTQGTLNPVLETVPAMRRDITLREKLVVAPLVLLLLLLGFYPKPVTDVINPAIKYTMQDLGTKDPSATTMDANGKAAR